MTKLPKRIQRLIFNSPLLMKYVVRESWWGLDGLDKIIVERLEKRNGYFIEIGANNGIAQSNTKHLELFRDWTGLLVEPDPENFKRLSTTRKRSVAKIHAACVSFHYELPLVKLYYSNLLTVAENLESTIDDAEAWALGAEFLIPDGGKVREFFAPAKTLTSIMDEVGSPTNVDFFSLDVEGAELEVLKGIDFSRYKFDHLLVELDSPDSVIAFLSGKGYRLLDKISYHDYWFVSEDRRASC